MAERGRLYHWPRNRSFGDSKRGPVVVIAPEAATSRSRRWVVLPLSSDPRLEGQPLAYPLDPSPGNGLQQRSYVGPPEQDQIDCTTMDVSSFWR